MELSIATQRGELGSPLGGSPGPEGSRREEAELEASPRPADQGAGEGGAPDREEPLVVVALVRAALVGV